LQSFWVLHRYLLQPIIELQIWSREEGEKGDLVDYSTIEGRRLKKDHEIALCVLLLVEFSQLILIAEHFDGKNANALFPNFASKVRRFGLNASHIVTRS
jgi:hypothetical protein